MSFSASLSFRLLDCLLPLSLYFPQVPTGSHCLSPPPSPSGYWIAYFPFLSTFPKYRRAHIVFLPPPLPFRLLAFLLSLSLYFLQVPKSSHCLSSYPLAFRLLNCPTFYYSTPHFSSLSRRTVRLAFLSSSPLAFRLLNCPTFYYSTPHFSSRSRCTVRLALAFSHFLYIIGILINHWR